MVDQTSSAPKTVDARDVALRMKLDYSHGVKDQTMRHLEAVSGLCSKIERPNLDTDAVLKETADLITRVFGIESVTICVRDPADRKYRYRVIVGLDKENADGFKDIAYTREQLENSSTYPSHEISRRTRLFLTEDHPYAPGEESTYRRPGLIGMRRRSINDSLEADYIDFFFYGQDADILGFIETSGTRLKKLPDSETVRWIELIASILGIAFQKKP